MKRPRLIPAEPSYDTIECLTSLLSKARSGELVGLAFGALYRRHNYAVHAVGEAHRNPTFARGMVAALDDELSHRVHSGDE